MCWQESPIVAQNEVTIWSKDTFIQRCVLLAVATERDAWRSRERVWVSSNLPCVSIGFSDTHRHLSVGTPFTWVQSGAQRLHGSQRSAAILLHGEEPGVRTSQRFSDAWRALRVIKMNQEPGTKKKYQNTENGRDEGQ